MRPLKITFFFLLISLTALAQSGIVFQGIARDNNSAAITDETMQFTFSITESNGVNLYSETQQIKTDNFGVFSHIIGTGSSSSSISFNQIDFTKENLKSKINVNYNGSDIEIYNQPFEYVPYAKHSQTSQNASNGVPVGTIVPFIGQESDVPDGWVLCNGEPITDVKFENLRSLLGRSFAPDLRGYFLKGAGTNANDSNTQGTLAENAHEPINLLEVQGSDNKKHRHNIDLTTSNNTSNHKHNVTIGVEVITDSDDNGSRKVLAVNSTNGNQTYTTNENSSNHKHEVEGDTAYQGNSKEARPNSFGVNYIIKY